MDSTDVVFMDFIATPLPNYYERPACISSLSCCYVRMCKFVLRYDALETTRQERENFKSVMPILIMRMIEKTPKSQWGSLRCDLKVLIRFLEEVRW